MTNIQMTIKHIYIKRDIRVARPDMRPTLASSSGQDFRVMG